MRVVLLVAVVAYLVVPACGQTGRASTPDRNTQEGKTTAGRGVTVLPRPQWKPSLTLRRALQQMEDYIEKEKIDTSSHYLLEARMIQYGSGRESKEPRWFFFWAHVSGADGVQLEFTVSMDGKVMRLASF